MCNQTPASGDCNRAVRAAPAAAHPAYLATHDLYNKDIWWRILNHILNFQPCMLTSASSQSKVTIIIQVEHFLTRLHWGCCAMHKHRAAKSWDLEVLGNSSREQHWKLPPTYKIFSWKKGKQSLGTSNHETVFPHSTATQHQDIWAPMLNHFATLGMNVFSGMLSRGSHNASRCCFYLYVQSNTKDMMSEFQIISIIMKILT